MRYLSVAEMAKKWDVSERSVRNYCAHGRVPGAFLTGKTWNIPENAEKPERTNKKKEKPTTLLDVLQDEKANKYAGGIYHKTQIDLTYNSNHMEGSRLTHDQTRYIFETNTIGIEKRSKGMRNFNYSAIKYQKWDSEILGLIAAIYKEAGKQEMYLKQRPEELDKLVEIAKIQSTEASNAIEGIVTTSTRIRQLVEEKTTPKNRDEQEIAGYRDVLNVIHDSFDAIPITKNYILQLHKMLYSHMNNPLAGQTKNVQNYISATYPDGHVEVLFTPLAPFETQEALDRICEEYNRVIGNMELEPLIAISVFIHDFLCIHPFNDGNGRMSRLLTTLLLYRSGFYVGKYVSLEAKIAKNKDLYYEALAAAQPGWHDGTEDVVPFIKYLLGTILAAYKDFEDRMALVEIKLPALEMVRRASHNKIGRFNKQDIRELCPTLSDSSIEGALRKLVASGELRKEGKGKNTCYFGVR